MSGLYHHMGRRGGKAHFDLFCFIKCVLLLTNLEFGIQWSFSPTRSLRYSSVFELHDRLSYCHKSNELSLTDRILNNNTYLIKNNEFLIIYSFLPKCTEKGSVSRNVRLYNVG